MMTDEAYATYLASMDTSGYEFRCRKCEARMSSKCPNERTVFPADGRVTLYGNLTTFARKEVRPAAEARPALYELSIGWGLMTAEQYKSDESMLMEFLNVMNSMHPKQIKQMLCQHHWTLPKGMKCSFGHSHRPPVETPA